MNSKKVLSPSLVFFKEEKRPTYLIDKNVSKDKHKNNLHKAMNLYESSIIKQGRF
jgi:hypothetical protein